MKADPNERLGIFDHVSVTASNWPSGEIARRSAELSPIERSRESCSYPVAASQITSISIATSATKRPIGREGNVAKPVGLPVAPLAA
jgi:hypothetical protein